MSREREDDIGLLDSSERLVQAVDRVVSPIAFLWGLLSKPVLGLLEWTKKKIEWISEKNELNKKKFLILWGIIGSGTVKQNKNEFLNFFNEGIITEAEVKEAIRIYLNTKSLQVFGRITTWIMKKMRGKKVCLPEYVSELTEIEKQLIAYWLKTKLITWVLSSYLSFENGENVEYYVKNYGNMDLIGIYFAQLLLDVRTHV